MTEVSHYNVIKMISSLLEENITVVQSEKLNTQLGIDVYRIHCTNVLNQKRTFIYKEFIPSGIPNEDFLRYKLRTEMLNYSFLMGIREQFSRFPKLYDYDLNSNAFLLEDLGSEPFYFNGEYLKELLDTMALMQVSSKYKKDEYLNLNTSNKFIEENLVYQEQNQIVATLAQDIIADYLKTMFNIDPTSFTNLTKKVIQDVHHSGDYESFIHYDFVDGRQSAMKDGKVMLLDFEMGRFSHSLLEIAVLLMGKIEVNVDINKRHYTHKNISNEIIEAYRLKTEKLSKRPIVKDEWNHEMGNCLIYHTLSLIKQREIGLQKVQMFSFLSDLKIIINRLLYCLEPINSHNELKEFFQKISEKIMI